jgi:hypothetical protein
MYYAFPTVGIHEEMMHLIRDGIQERMCNCSEPIVWIAGLSAVLVRAPPIAVNGITQQGRSTCKT